MKKVLFLFLVSGLIIFNSGCATILSGKVSQCQKEKPKAGEPQREVRVGYLIFDIVLTGPFTVIDFATGAIYKPCVIIRIAD